jgi:hypothetical protein
MASAHASIYLRPQSRGYVARFLKVPLGWVLLAALVAVIVMESNVREQNRMACGAVFMMLDRQQFQGFVQDASRSQTRLILACDGLESPDTFQAGAALDASNAFNR